MPLIEDTAAMNVCCKSVTNCFANKGRYIRSLNSYSSSGARRLLPMAGNFASGYTRRPRLGYTSVLASHQQSVASGDAALKQGHSFF